MDRAVRPLVSDANVHFRPEAGPISGEMCLRLRVWERSGRNEEEEELLLLMLMVVGFNGPEMGILGFFHVPEVST